MSGAGFAATHAREEIGATKASSSLKIGKLLFLDNPSAETVRDEQVKQIGAVALTNREDAATRNAAVDFLIGVAVAKREIVSLRAVNFLVEAVNHGAADRAEEVAALLKTEDTKHLQPRFASYRRDVGQPKLVAKIA